MSNVELQEVTDTVSVLVYEARATRGTPGTDYRAFVSSVYVKREAAWMLVFHQQTIAE
ncbi:MAG: hypothetical protein R3304_05380 [Longimicrobiales bacterium]|nr:hypothetical protein [Longimicrobiales bacterium]